MVQQKNGWIRGSTTNMNECGRRHRTRISLGVERTTKGARETDLRRSASDVSLTQPAFALVGNVGRDQDIALAVSGDVQPQKGRRRQTRRESQRKTSSYIILTVSCKHKIMPYVPYMYIHTCTCILQPNMQILQTKLQSTNNGHLQGVHF